MRVRTHCGWLGVTTVLVIAIHGASALAQPAAAPAGSQMTQPMTLTDAQLKGFFDVMDELRAKGQATGTNVNQPSAFAQGLQLSQESQAALQSHGFTSPAEFQRVAYNAALAYGVLNQGGKEAVRRKVAAAKAEQQQAMDKMRQQLPPDQLKMLTAQMAQGLAAAEAMENVPDQNLMLMQKYRDRMTKLTKK